MIFIVAGSHREARFWANQLVIPRKNWTFLDWMGIEKIYGTRNPDVIFVGSWKSLPDWDRVAIEVSSRFF